MKNQEEKENINSLAGRLLAKKKFTFDYANSEIKTAAKRRLNNFYESEVEASASNKKGKKNSK